MAPFLKRVLLKPISAARRSFPYTIPAFARGFDLTFDRPVVMLVGENGSGKSTFLESIAWECGFNVRGGNRNHVMFSATEKPPLADKLKLEWLPKIGTGFFFRAESFFDFASSIDELARSDRGILDYYGGKPLHAQSHGESFLALFNNHFGRPGIYLLDEPEAALSPTRQLSLLRIIHDMEKNGQSQFIIATHSPILLSYPGATLYAFGEDGVTPTAYKQTEHYSVTKEFLDNPERYYKNLFSD